MSTWLHGYMAAWLYVCTFSLSCTDFPIRMCSAVYPGFETLFCEFTTCPFRVSSLCLSRACLGKMIRFRPKVSQKTVFLPGYLGVHDVGARAVPVGVRVDRHLLTRKRISITQLFLRLSRACLGKMILSSINMASQKMDRHHCLRDERHEVPEAHDLFLDPLGVVQVDLQPLLIVQTLRAGGRACKHMDE